MTKYKKFHGLLVEANSGLFLYLSDNNSTIPSYKQITLGKDWKNIDNTVETYTSVFTEEQINNLCERANIIILKCNGKTYNNKSPCKDCT